MHRKLQLVTGVVLAAALLPGGAAAGQAGGNEYSFTLSSHAPATATGMGLRVLYRHPQDPDAKPPPIQELVVQLPAGLRFDTGVVPSCEASDGDLRALGRGACPSASRIGAGTLTAVTGIPGAAPVETDVTVFNGGDELVELVSFKGTNVTAGSDRLQIQGDRLIAHPPAVPGGPPDGRTTVREIAIAIDRLVSGGGGSPRSFITTPADCPAGGAWTSRLTVAFASYDPVSVLGETPCTTHETVAGRPRMSLSVTPRRVRVGTRTLFRARLRSSAPDCRRGVRLRLGRRRAVTNDRGRARMTVRLNHRGRRLVRATKRGCLGARAWVLVR